MQEDIRYLLDADDKATAKIIKVNRSIDEQVKHVREVGGQAKASTELVGTLASSMGAAGIGGFAGEIAMLTERVSAFSEVSKAGGAGALAFKAGLAGAAAVISVKVGEALGNVIWQTDKWNSKLEENLQLYNEIGNELEQRFVARLKEQVDIASKLAAETGNASKLEEVQNQLKREQIGLENQIASAIAKKREAEEAYYQTAVTASTIEKANADIARARSEIKALREMQIQATAQAVQDAKAAEIIEEQNKRRERGNDILRNMIRDLAILKASEEDRERLEFAKQGLFGEEQIQQAIELQRQMNQLKDEQVAKEQAIKDAQKQRVNELKAQSEQEKEQIQLLQERIRSLGQASGQSSIAGPLSAGASTRLATGAGSEFRKTAAVIEAERQTAIQKRQEQLQERLVQLMEKNQQTQISINVIGN